MSRANLYDEVLSFLHLEHFSKTVVSLPKLVTTITNICPGNPWEVTYVKILLSKESFDLI